MRIAVSYLLFTLGALGGLAAVSGCQASVEGKVETGGEGTSDFNEPMEPQFSAQQAESTTPSQDVALLGARQDLTYRGPATTQCKCLAVAAGQPGDAAFQWSGERPQISSASQMVVALSSAGIECPEAGPNTGASYWGYEVSGNDVVVVVETASPNHPLASGAIIPRPGPGGHVYVRPLEKKLPYGKPASGTGTRCKIAAPSAPAAPSPATPAPSPAPVAEAPERPIPPPMPSAEGSGQGTVKGGVTKGIKVPKK